MTTAERELLMLVAQTLTCQGTYTTRKDIFLALSKVKNEQTLEQKLEGAKHG